MGYRNKLDSGYKAHSAKTASIKRSYGLSEVDLMGMVDNQMGMCPVCGISLVHPDSNRAYCIDHNYNTKKIEDYFANLATLGWGILKTVPRF